MKNHVPQLWLSAGTAQRSLGKEDTGDVMKMLRQARLIIGVFYFVVFTTSVQTFSYFYQFPDWSTLLASRHLFDPLWSSMWMRWFDWEWSVRAVLLMHFVGSLLAMIFWERWRWIRVVAFVTTFQYLSLISSFGKIDHYMHIMVVVQFMLIFLPQDHSYRTLKVLFGIQTFILLTYFISGAFKFLGIVTQELAGQMSALSPGGLGQHIAKGVFITGRPTFFSSYLLAHPSWLASALLVAGYLIEVCSVLIIFFPGLHRLWGFVLLAFHAAILMTVGPDFTLQMLVVGIFLVFSPFAMGGLTPACTNTPAKT